MPEFWEADPVIQQAPAAESGEWWKKDPIIQAPAQPKSLTPLTDAAPLIQLKDTPSIAPRFDFSNTPQQPTFRTPENIGVPLPGGGELERTRQRAISEGVAVLENTDQRPIVEIPRPSEETTQALGETLADILPILEGKRTSQTTENLGKAAAGVLSGMAGVVEAIETPEVIAALASGKVHPALQKAVQAAFTGEVARSIPAQIKESATAFGEGNVRKGFEAGTGAVVGAYVLPKLAGETLHDVAARTEATGSIKTAASLRAIPESKAANPGEGQQVFQTTPETQGAINQTSPVSVLPPTPFSAEPKAISQVIRDLSTGLDIPIRFRRLTTSKFAGYFKPKANLIGSKMANDITTVSHEVGHKLDDLFKIRNNPALTGELMHLGDNLRPGSASSWTPSKPIDYRLGEGVAEFVRYWMTDPAEATRLAPNLERAFNATIESNPDMAAILRTARDDVQTWRSADPQARLRSKISVGENPNKTPYTLAQLTTDVIDDLHFLKLATDDAQLLNVPKLLPSENPYLLSRNLRGAFGEADTFIQRGAVDFKTRSVDLNNSFKKAVEPVQEKIADFRDWIVAKQAQEVIVKGKETGLLKADVDFTVKKFAGDATFQKAFDDLHRWSDALLQYAVDAGSLSKESADAMRAMWNEYVPLHKVYEVGAGELAQKGGTGRGLNQVGNAFKNRKGGVSDIVDPLETWMKNAYAIITNAEKNAINTALADFADMKGMGRWVEKIATPKEEVKVGIEKLREELTNLGADVSAIPDGTMLDFFRDSSQAPFGENIIKVNRAGKAEFYRLDSDLFRTMQGLDFDTSGALVRVFSNMAQLLRAGATLTPDFALMNAMRDGVNSAIVSRYGSAPFEATIRGLFAMVRRPDLVDEWAASGGKQSVEATYFDRDKLQAFMRDKILNDMTPAERALVVVKSPLSALRWLTGTLEEATRLGEFQKVVEAKTAKGMPIGEARRQAAFEARDLQDFALRGAKTSIMKRLVAFWGASVSGNYRLWTAFKENPVGTLAKGLGIITAAKMAEFLVNQDDEDYWDRPQWERDLFFMIPIGKDDSGHTRFMRVPTPFEVGLLFGTIPGRLLQWTKQHDPKAAEGIVNQMRSQAFPTPMPQSVLTTIEVMAGKQGYSFFKGKPIVPESLKDFPADLQFTEQTSLTAKKIGAAMGVSPMKVDYAIQGLTGGLGKQATHQVVDRAIELATGEERTAKGVMPGSRLLSSPFGTASQAVDDFYEKLALLREEAQRRKATGESKVDLANLQGMEQTASDMSQLRKLMRKAPDDAKKNEIAGMIIEKAKLWKNR